MWDRHCAYQREIASYVFGVTAKNFSHGVLLCRSKTVLRSRLAQREGKSDSESQLAALIVGQVDDDGVFIGAKELGRVIVGVAEDFMKERFACALHGDALAACPATSTVSGETP